MLRRGSPQLSWGKCPSEIKEIPVTGKPTKSGKPSCVFSRKDFILLDSSQTKMVSYSAMKDILSILSEHFKEILDPVTITPSDTQEMFLGEESTITAAENFLAVKTLKAGEAAGCDEILPEMLKTLNRERVYWLICMCQVVRRSRRAPKDWQTGVSIHIHKKGEKREATLS